MIRPFSLRDILTIRRLAPQGVAFDLERLLLDTSAPVSSAIAGYLTRSHLGAVTCIHDGAGDQHDLRGFVQALPNIRASRWDLAYLAPALSQQPGASDVWYRLLTYLVIYAAEQRVGRVFARSAEDSEAEDLFRQAGFRAALREEVFKLPGAQPRVPMPKPLRPVTEQDRWALQQFYGRAVPRQAQDPDSGLSYRTTRNPSTLSISTILGEYVWSYREQILAYYGLLSGPRGCWLEVLVRPEHRGDILHHLRFMLGLPPAESGPIYCGVPDYSVGLAWLLRTLHFEPQARQVLMIAQTAVRERVRHGVLVSRLEGNVETSVSIQMPSRTVAGSYVDGLQVRSGAQQSKVCH